MPPNAPTAASTSASQAARSPTSADSCDGLPARLPDARCRLLGDVRVQVADDDPGAPLGEQLAVGATHAAPAAGDDGDPAGEGLRRAHDRRASAAATRSCSRCAVYWLTAAR